MNRKNIFFWIMMCCFAGLGNAQQEALHTQFMYNKTGVNPAAAGSTDSPCLTAIYRSQWIGLEGAPEVQLLNLQAPVLNKRIGLGLNINRQVATIFERMTITGIYSYRVRLGEGMLALGLQASLRSFRADYNDPRLQSTQLLSGDGGLPAGDQQKLLPNFGTGFFYSQKDFFVGISIPRLVRNSIDFNDISGVLSREVLHIYLMGGKSFKLNNYLELIPQVQFRLAEHSPVDVDLNVSLTLVESYTLGVSFRHAYHRSDFAFFEAESLDFLLSAYVSPFLMFGLSYDATLNELKQYGNGSLEGVVRYCFGKDEGVDIVNPRFF